MRTSHRLDYRAGRRPAVVAGVIALVAALAGGTALVVGRHHDREPHTRPTPTLTPAPTPSPSRPTRPRHSPTPRGTTPPASPTPVITATSFPVFGHTVESSDTLPGKDAWLADVAATLDQSRASAYLLQRARSGHGRLAINLDIDNTVNESHYGGSAIPSMYDLVQQAHRLGYGILFNTGREDRIRTRTLALLHRDGLPVDGLCMRRSGEGLVHGKQRCRDEYARAGWTLVENIGNNPTDLAGDGYELGIMLPNYGGRLS